MKKPQVKGVWLTAILVLATAAVAQNTSIQLPPDNPVAQLKPGAGDNVVHRDCSICHSTDYIVRQPHLDAQHWDAEVKKMITVYGAPIKEDDAKTIADYLAKNYSSDGDQPKKTETGQP